MLNLSSDAVHEDRVQRGNVLGSFCGQPIITIDEFGAEADDAADLNFRLMVSSHTSIPAEVLPGEIICNDGIIRRVTTAEAVGYDTYHNQEQIEAGTVRYPVDAARSFSKAGLMVYYRPDKHVGAGEYALVTEE
jgi:hypothetical protein